MTNKLSFDIPDYKKIRVIIDTDAACEADDPFAISHALMCRKLIVKGITAEHFVEEGSVQKSLAELESKVLPYGKIGHHLFTQMVEYNMTERAAWTQGERWALGDSPAVGIAMYPRCGKYVEREAKLFNHDELTSYGENIPGRKIRVYESVDSHFILEDFFAKLKINFSE